MPVSLLEILQGGFRCSFSLCSCFTKEVVHVYVCMYEYICKRLETQPVTGGRPCVYHELAVVWSLVKESDAASARMDEPSPEKSEWDRCFVCVVL